MNSGKHTLHHIGPIQAVNAIHAEHTLLPAGHPLTIHIEAERLKVTPDFIPQQAQPAVLRAMYPRLVQLASKIQLPCLEWPHPLKPDGISIRRCDSPWMVAMLRDVQIVLDGGRIKKPLSGKLSCLHKNFEPARSVAIYFVVSRCDQLSNEGVKMQDTNTDMIVQK